MLKSLNLSEEDVKSFINGNKNELRTTVERVFVLANEGANVEEKAQFSAEDAKVIKHVILDMQNRIDILNSMTAAQESGFNTWIKEVLTEDKTSWVPEFSKRINNAQTVSQLLKVIEEIDDKIDDCREVLEDDITARSIVRKLIQVGVISIGASVAGAVGAAVAIGAAAAQTVNINKGKTLIRQVMNELLTLRKKALVKRDQLRKNEYHDQRDDGMDNEHTEDEDYSYGEESPKAVYEKLMNLK